MAQLRQDPERLPVVSLPASSPVSSSRVRDRSVSGLQRDAGPNSLSPQRSDSGNRQPAQPQQPLNADGAETAAMKCLPIHMRSSSLDLEVGCHNHANANCAPAVLPSLPLLPPSPSPSPTAPCIAASASPPVVNTTAASAAPAPQQIVANSTANAVNIAAAAAVPAVVSAAAAATSVPSACETAPAENGAASLSVAAPRVSVRLRCVEWRQDATTRRVRNSKKPNQI